MSQGQILSILAACFELSRYFTADVTDDKSSLKISLLPNFRTYFAEKMLLNSIVKKTDILRIVEIDAHILEPHKGHFTRAFRTYSEEIHGLSQEVFPNSEEYHGYSQEFSGQIHGSFWTYSREFSGHIHESFWTYSREFSGHIHESFWTYSRELSGHIHESVVVGTRECNWLDP